MCAPLWSATALGASVAALPWTRAAAADESAMAAAARLSGEEERGRFSTRRSFPVPGLAFDGADPRMWVVVALRGRGAARTPVALQRVLVRRIGAAQRL